jgi:hypothetical protein
VPGPGNLLVRGPGHDYIPIDVSERFLIDGRNGGGRAYFPDALVPLNPLPGIDPAPVTAHLRRGVMLTGRVVTAQGEPVASGFLISRTFLGSGWETHSEFLPVKDGRFEIPGCDPAAAEPYWFWDHKALQGALVHLSGKDQDKTVRLAPFGSASVRFVDDKGAPLRLQGVHAKLVVRPGADPLGSWDKNEPARLTQYADFQGVRHDADTGTVTVRAMVPGATYVVEAGVDIASPPFSVGPGQHLRLPDVVVRPPPTKRP